MRRNSDSPSRYRWLALACLYYGTLTGCAGLPGGAEHQTDNACSFAYFLPTGLNYAAMGACTWGKDAIFGVDEDATLKKGHKKQKAPKEEPEEDEN